MNRLLLLFIFVLLSASLGAQVYYKASIPLFDGDRYLGDVEVEIKDEKLVTLNRNSLRSVLASAIKPELISRLDGGSETIGPEQLPFPIHFNAQDLKLETKLRVEDRSSERLDVLEDFKARYGNQVLDPAPFGGAINYRLEQTTSSLEEQRFFTGQFDSFFNLKDLVLENQSFYNSDQSRNWFRGDTRLVKDFPKSQVRAQVGDIYPQSQGFMVSRPIGGVSLSRNFSLNPYRFPYPLGEQSFTLEARSQVRYYVNNIFIKSEYLPPGNYTAKDIPLNNGLNTITIEAVDDSGNKRYFVFRTAASINLLNPGESRFDLSYGVSFLDQDFQRRYQNDEGKIFSGFYQYGFTSTLSASVYGQDDAEFSLLGSEIIKATILGNFSLGHAESQVGKLRGSAQSLGYQLINQGTNWYNSQSVGLRWEHRSLDFRNLATAQSSAIQNNYSANYTLPIPNLLTISVGGNYGDVRDNSLEDRYGFDTTLTARIFDHHNLSFFLGRTRDEFRRWNDVAYVFLTITFPGSNNFLSAFYDQTQKLSRLSYVKDNQNRLHDPRIIANVDQSRQSERGEVDVTYPTAFADFGARLGGNRLESGADYQHNASARLNSAFVFAYNDGWGAGLSRPIANSFAIFKPGENLKGQKIALKSFSAFTEAESGLFDEIVYNNLLAYQYREVQLDPTLLELGRSLEKEKFVLLPGYRSAHLIHLADRGSVILRGRLVDRKGTPLALVVGRIGDLTFFTNRDGDFFVEGVLPGTHELQLDGKSESVEFEVKESEIGIKDLGILKLKD